MMCRCLFSVGNMIVHAKLEPHGVKKIPFLWLHVCAMLMRPKCITDDVYGKLKDTMENLKWTIHASHAAFESPGEMGEEKQQEGVDEVSCARREDTYLAHLLTLELPQMDRMA